MSFVTLGQGVVNSTHLNCYQIACAEAALRGDELLTHGFARDSTGEDRNHVWIVRNGRIIDHMNWTDHSVVFEAPADGVYGGRMLRYLRDEFPHVYRRLTRCWELITDLDPIIECWPYGQHGRITVTYTTRIDGSPEVWEAEGQVMNNSMSFVKGRY